MRLSVLLWCAAALSCGFWTQLGYGQPAVRPEAPTPPPFFEGKELPTPPQQAEPWMSPATKLPESLLSTAVFLFEHGCADPRGCEYREVTVPTGSVWGENGWRKATHGWVLPDDGKGNGRFAVCWNGLVYPVLDIGEPVPLANDVTVLPKWDRWTSAIAEGDAVDYKHPWLVRVCLLLRLGEVELAEKLWIAPQAGTRKGQNAADDPFLRIANDWLWYSLDRAICAHMRGDHQFSLLTAELLAKHRPAFEAEAKRRGFEKPGVNFHRPDNDAISYYEFLEPLAPLLAEQQRRVAQGPVVRVLGAPKETYAEQPARVAALIHDLEEVAARQWSQPGGVSLVEDPIMKALKAEGDAAVEPLLACFENDNRLTRSVSFHRDFGTNRNLIGVHQAAYSSLCSILESRIFDDQVRPDDRTPEAKQERRRKIAAEIRQYWEKRRTLSKEEGWFLTLQDDNATSKQWLEAATQIAWPTDVTTNGEWVSIPNRKEGFIPAVKGESLRNKTNPSVTELLAERSDQMAGKYERDFLGYRKLQEASQVAICLSRWDQKAALPTLQLRIRDCLNAIHAEEKNQHSATTVLTATLPKLMKANILAGDRTLMVDYFEWVSGSSAKDILGALHTGEADLFAPLWITPNEEATQKLADQLFNGPNSVWNPVHLASSRGGSFSGEELTASPLVSLPAFRQQLQRNLLDLKVVGTIVVKDYQVSIKRANGSRGTGLRYYRDPLLPKTDTPQDFRVCDLYAQQTAQLEGAPLFELYWPEAVRDEALIKVRKFVEHWGPRYGKVASPYSRRSYPGFGTYAAFTLPPLDHPATDEDVKQGRAIFSLGIDKPVRTVAVKPFPQPALWTTLKDFPMTRNTGAPVAELVVTYDQDGEIWQAEEVQENGEWKRYYGFVGRHIIARVPASEIEFPKEPESVPAPK